MENIIREKLLSLQDEKYKAFTAKLIPNISADKIIGVRTPIIRNLAKELKTNENIAKFLNSLPHKFQEENILHAFLINQMSSFENCVEELNCLLPYVDNWAVCDGIRPKTFKKNTDKLMLYIEKWLCSSDTYTIRFGIECLMTYYLDSEFQDKFLKKVSEVKSDEYYINMMIAWYFATALAKQWDSAVKYIEQCKLPKWVHNKTIQKAIESYRISDKRKSYLKTLKIY